MKDANKYMRFDHAAANVDNVPFVDEKVYTVRDKEQLIAQALSSHDTEVREVLEGLRGRTGSQNCWCDAEDEDSHYLSCFAADELYARLQPKESSDVTE